FCTPCASISTALTSLLRCLSRAPRAACHKVIPQSLSPSGSDWTSWGGQGRSGPSRSTSGRPLHGSQGSRSTALGKQCWTRMSHLPSLADRVRAEPRCAGDGIQLTLRFSFQLRLTPSVIAPRKGVIAWGILSPERCHLLALEVHRGLGEFVGSKAEPCHGVAAEDTAPLLVGQARNKRHQPHRLGELAVPVSVIRGIHDQMLAHGLEHVGENGLFWLAGEGDLATANDLRGLALAEVPLRPQLFEMFVQSLGPEGQPATGALD